MTEEEIQHLPNGVYAIEWDDIGYSIEWSDTFRASSRHGPRSVAAVGRDSKSKVWLHPTNWISGPTLDWSKVKSAILIATQEDWND